MALIDLHIHTTASDGLSDPAVIVAQVQAAGIAIFAVTDHDTVAAVPEVARLASDAGVTFRPWHRDHRCRPRQGRTRAGLLRRCLVSCAAERARGEPSRSPSTRPSHVREAHRCRGPHWISMRSSETIVSSNRAGRSSRARWSPMRWSGRATSPHGRKRSIGILPRVSPGMCPASGCPPWRWSDSYNQPGASRLWPTRE